MLSLGRCGIMGSDGLRLGQFRSVQLSFGRCVESSHVAIDSGIMRCIAVCSVELRQVGRG